MCEWENVETLCGWCVSDVHLCLCTHMPAACGSGRRAQRVRTPSDSALHGQDSCFMSMGSHKLHGFAFLLQQHGADLSLPSASSLVLILLGSFFLSLTHVCFLSSCYLLPQYMPSRCSVSVYFKTLRALM